MARNEDNTKCVVMLYLLFDVVFYSLHGPNSLVWLGQPGLVGPLVCACFLLTAILKVIFTLPLNDMTQLGFLWEEEVSRVYSSCL